MIKSKIKKLAKGNWILILVIFIAFLIRIVGLFPGHNTYHPDEPMSYSAATDMVINHDLNPRRFDYPAGVPLIHYVVYKTAILPIALSQFALSHPNLLPAMFFDKEFLHNNAAVIFGIGYTNALFWSRYITAFLSILCVYLLYLLGTKLCNKTAGLAAAFFLAVNYRFALSSHLALSDIPNSFFILLAFYSCLLLLEKNTKKRYLISGTLIGISVSMKYQIFGLFPFLFAHGYWVLKKRNIKEIWNTHFLTSVAFIPLVFVLLNPYFFSNLKFSLAQMHDAVSIRYYPGYNHFNFYAVFYLYKWGIGQLPFLTIVLGFFLMAILKRKNFLFLLSIIVPFLYIFLYYLLGGIYIRNFTTIIPFLLLGAGFACSLLFNFLKRRVAKNIAVVLFIIIAVAINSSALYNSIILDANYTTSWNRDRLNEWVIKNLPKNIQIRNDNDGIAANADETFHLINWDYKSAISIQELVAKKDNFAVLNVGQYHDTFFLWYSHAAPQELLRLRDIPYQDYKDTYQGMALSELLRYSVKDIYRSWQSPDDNYLVIKIPKGSEEKGESIAAYNFDKGLDEWSAYDFNGDILNNVATWDNSIGNQGNGSIKSNGVSAFAAKSRVTSPIVKITPGKIYQVFGFIKSDIAISEEKKDAFLRIDFYSSVDSKRVGESIEKAVSAREFGDTQWQQEEVFAKAPQDANFLTVSFQRSKSSKNTYWIDDVTVSEFDTLPTQPFPNIPYISPTIPKNVLYVNSIY